MVADVGQHLIEQRKLGFERGNRQPGVGHQREQADGFERDGFAAGVGAADQQRAHRLIERKRNRDDALSLRAQDVFEQRMAGAAEDQLAGAIGT